MNLFVLNFSSHIIFISFTVSKIKFNLEIVCLLCLMSVRLITHYSDYYDTDYWILIFTLENKTYVKFVFKNFCLRSSKKNLCCPVEVIP